MGLVRRRNLAFIAMLVFVVACGATPAASPSPTPSAVASASVSPSLNPSLAPSPTALASASPSPAAASGGGLLFMRMTEQPLDGPWPKTAEIVPVAGGPAVVLGTAIDAAWAADGRSVHLVSEDEGCVPSLTTVSPDGTVLGTVRGGLKEQDSAFAWSPSGEQVAFLRFHNGAPSRSCGSQGGTYTGDEVVQDVILMDADGTGQHVLVPMVYPSRPLAWSPDGSLILVPNAAPSRNIDVLETLLVSPADGAQTTLEGISFIDMSSPRWSPDGSRLACTLFKDGARAIGVISIAAHTRADFGAGDPRTHEPSWSPDGASIAAAFDLVQPDGSYVAGDVAIRGVDGSGRRVLGLTDVQVFSEPPSWSPDGERLAYVATAADGGGFGGIALVGLDGRDRTAVAGTEGAQWVVWQPVPAGDQ
jgi:Tol biopolymer transport system component